MLLQALFSRGGGTIHHNISGFSYAFKKNKHGDFVAPVLSAEHREMMIKSGNFRPYEEPAENLDPPRADAEDPEPAKGKKKGKRVKK